jgi:type I restriction enzyme S subunit
MKIKTVPIKDCADVLPGFSIKTSISHDPGGTHQLVLAKHLPDIGPYEYKEEHELVISPERPSEKYRVSAGDILFMSRGVLNRAILIKSVPENTLASASFYIIRPGKTVDPGYLAYCLNQELFRNRINEIRTGAGTPLVPRADFSQIQIALPPIEEQKKIARLGNLIIHEKVLMNRMQEKLELKHRLLGKKIFNKLEHSSLKKE